MGGPVNIILVKSAYSGLLMASVASIFLRCSPFRNAVATKYFANEVDGRKAVSLSNRRPASRDCHNPRSADLTHVEFRKHAGFDRVQKLSWPLIQTSRDIDLARSMRDQGIEEKRLTRTPDNEPKCEVAKNDP